LQLARKEKNKEANAVTTGSELESEAPAESGVDDDSVPAAKPHVEFSPAIVVDAPRDTPPNIKVCVLKLLMILTKHFDITTVWRGWVLYRVVSKSIYLVF
jgi:hypothetical protein